MDMRIAVVGAGPAGISASLALARRGLPHVVLERSRVGETWRSQRWDSFRLNTPSSLSGVAGPSLAAAGNDFARAGNLVAALAELAGTLPVQEGVDVLAAAPHSGGWRLETTDGVIDAAELVVASGFQNVPLRPALAGRLPQSVTQLHAGDYRSPDALPEGGVFVVGGAQSGLQIAEDIVEAGRRVHLATSRVGRLPRRYRRRDSMEWLAITGALDARTEDVEPWRLDAAQSQISGIGGGRTVSYQSLAAAGATLLGRAENVVGERILLAGDLGANVRYADDQSLRFKTSVDTFVTDNLIAAPPPDPDPADEIDSALHATPGPAWLDLDGIGTVVWATGFGPSVDWLPQGAIGEHGRPRLPNLHTIGAPWLTHRASGTLHGMATDAEELAARLSHPARAAA
jgi:putative flavoprotein involved in K+ transport